MLHDIKKPKRNLGTYETIVFLTYDVKLDKKWYKKQQLMLLLMVKKRCFCSFWLKCTKIIIEDGSKVEEKYRGCSKFLGMLQTHSIFQEMRLKQVMALEVQISKAAQLSTSDAASLLSLFEDIIFGDIRYRAWKKLWPRRSDEKISLEQVGCMMNCVARAQSQQVKRENFDWYIILEGWRGSPASYSD